MNGRTWAIDGLILMFYVSYCDIVGWIDLTIPYRASCHRS